MRRRTGATIGLVALMAMIVLAVQAGEVCLADPVGASTSFYDTYVDVNRS